jgi:hypothetical protein
MEDKPIRSSPKRKVWGRGALCQELRHAAQVLTDVAKQMDKPLEHPLATQLRHVISDLNLAVTNIDIYKVPNRQLRRKILNTVKVIEGLLEEAMNTAVTVEEKALKQTARRPTGKRDKNEKLDLPNRRGQARTRSRLP